MVGQRNQWMKQPRTIYKDIAFGKYPMPFLYTIVLRDGCQEIDMRSMTDGIYYRVKYIFY